MKFAGTVLYFVGFWLIATMFIAALARGGCGAKLAYPQALQEVAPYRALLAAAVGLIGIGTWLYDKRPQP